MRLIPVAAAVLLVVAAMCSCSVENAPVADGRSPAAGEARSAGPEENEARSHVRIVEAGTVADHPLWSGGSYVVDYAVTNGGDAAASYYAELKFLDRDGDTLGSTGVTVDELGPGKTAKGNTAPLAVEITNGKIGDIRSVEIGEVTRTPVE